MRCTTLDTWSGLPAPNPRSSWSVTRGRAARISLPVKLAELASPPVWNRSKFTVDTSTCPLHSRSTRFARKLTLHLVLRSLRPSARPPSAVDKLASLFGFLFFVWVGLPAEQEL